jgi:hypothetical protein
VVPPLGCALLSLALGSGLGDCRAAEEQQDPEWAEEGRNELALFLGGARSGDENGFSVGLDYERRLNRRFGIGGVAESTGGDFRDGIVGIPLCWHPWKELKLLAAPGVEFAPSERSDEFLVRFGGEYGFDIGKGFEIAPSLYFDFTREERTVVLGASFAKRF